MFGSTGKSKEQRKAVRTKVNLNAWVRLDEGFAIRPCHVVDLSETGVQFTIDAPQNVRGTFTLLMSRNTRSGRRARVEWRNGSKIGAIFL